MTHTGAPILVTLANKAVSFNCSITYPDSPGLQNFTTWYFHVDLQGQESPREQIKCSPDLSRENQGHTLQCRVTPDLPSASATGMYYCCVRWPDSHRISEGVFILVRGEASCRAQRFHTAESGAQDPKRGMSASLISFGKTQQ